MKRLSSLVTLVAILGLASAASAATLTINSSGILTGATGVDVDGTLYDVVFVDTTCIVAFSGCDSNNDFTFTTESAAMSAAQALLDQVFLDGPGGNFDSMPWLTFGCEGTFDVCRAWTPYEILEDEDSVFSQLAMNGPPFFDLDLVVNGIASRNSDFAPTVEAVYAQWTPSDAAVPEPATLSLLGLGLAGMGVRRWRQRKTT